MSGTTQRRLLPDGSLRYADHADGILDVHLPGHLPDGPRRATKAGAGGGSHEHDRRLGVLVLLHGGFWKTEWDRTHTRPMARALADEGWVVVTPEYRRVGPGGSGGWPTTVADVRAAVAAVPEALRDLRDLDPLDGTAPTGTDVTLVGHSAGGHLALVAAALGADGVRVRRVVALAPVADVGEALRQGLGSDAARAFLGATPAEAADPLVLLDRRPDTAIAVVHGRDDDVVPVALSRNLVRRHPWVELLEVPGGHFEPIEPGSVAWPTVLEALRSQDQQSD